MEVLKAEMLSWLRGRDELGLSAAEIARHVGVNRQKKVAAKNITIRNNDPKLSSFLCQIAA